MRYTDKYLTTMADMHPVQLAWAPNEPDSLDPKDWATAYCAESERDTALSEIEADARERYNVSLEDGSEDEYDSLDDVPRDEVWRARIWENGSVDLYIDRPGPLTINEGEEPAFSFTQAQIFQSFGMDPFFPEFAAPAAGVHQCHIAFRLTDEAEFRECFLDGRADDLETANMMVIFDPAIDGLAGRLQSAPVTQTGEEMAPWRVSLTVELSDPALLMMQAAMIGRSAGRDGDYFPESIDDAIFEAWFGGNDSGAPLDMGFEIVSWEPEKAPQEPAQEDPGF